MKKLILVSFFWLCTQALFAQSDAIPAKEADKHVGKTVWVICDIKGVREAKEAGKPHFLNVGERYPNQTLTVSYTGDFKAKYGVELASLQGKTVRVQGKVTIYKEKPEIRNPEKIVLDTQAPASEKSTPLPATALKDSIDAKDARQYVGRTLWVKCEVKGTREAREEGKPHYINVGAPYPNHILTVVIIGDVREKYDLNLASLKDKTIWVWGTVELYKDALQIKNPREIVVK